MAIASKITASDYYNRRFDDIYGCNRTAQQEVERRMRQMMEAQAMQAMYYKTPNGLAQAGQIFAATTSTTGVTPPPKKKGIRAELQEEINGWLAGVAA